MTPETEAAVRRCLVKVEDAIRYRRYVEKMATLTGDKKLERSCADTIQHLEEIIEEIRREFGLEGK